jgi:hypothetical protein
VKVEVSEKQKEEIAELWEHAMKVLGLLKSAGPSEADCVMAVKTGAKELRDVLYMREARYKDVIGSMIGIFKILATEELRAALATAELAALLDAVDQRREP